MCQVSIVIKVLRSHPVINMEVLPPPPDEVLILTVPPWLWNTVLVVIDPTEIVEEPCSEVSHDCRDGPHPSHTAGVRLTVLVSCLINLPSHHISHSVLAITFHILNDPHSQIPSCATAALFCDYPM